MNFPQEKNERRTLRVTEAARVLGIPAASLYRHIAEGRLRAIRIGRTIRLRRADIEAILEEPVMAS